MQIKRTASKWESISCAIDKLLDMEAKQHTEKGIKTITNEEFDLMERLMIEITLDNNSWRKRERRRGKE